MKKLLITVFLLVLLAVSLMTLIAMYISGPSIKYDKEMQLEMDHIRQSSEASFLTLERHVFRYVTYIGETEDAYYWFDRDGRELLQKPKQEIHMEEASAYATEAHDLSDVKKSIGYGYENGAYVLENEEYLLLLDIDTLEEIYYRRK